MRRPALLVAMLLAGSCISACTGHIDHASHQELFIGWEGESYIPDKPAAAAGMQADADEARFHAQREQQPDPEVAPPPTAAATAPTVAADQHVVNLAAQRHTGVHASQPWVQHLSWHPRLHLYHNLLTADECDRMRQLLARPSSTVGGATDSSPEDEDAALHLMLGIEKRIANWTTLPPNHLEGWQLQHGFTSEDGQIHTDLLADRFATEDFERARAATVLLFLGDDDAPQSNSSAFSLLFPMARGGAWRGSAQPDEYAPIRTEGQQVHKRLLAVGAANVRDRREGSVLKLRVSSSDSPSSTGVGADICDGSSGIKAGLTVTGFSKGSALLIWNLLPDGQTPDASASHLFCDAAAHAPQGGDKDVSHPWIATTWLHTMPFGEDNALQLASTCEDKNPACSHWAEQGFCDDAPGAMLGLRGMCRASCGDCSSCQRLKPSQASLDAPSTAAGSRHQDEYLECLFRNMHSRRKAWSRAAREAGVRRARNAIRRDLRWQAAAAWQQAAAAQQEGSSDAAASDGASGGLGQSSWHSS